MQKKKKTQNKAPENQGQKPLGGQQEDGAYLKARTACGLFVFLSVWCVCACVPRSEPVRFNFEGCKRLCSRQLKTSDIHDVIQNITVLDKTSQSWTEHHAQDSIIASLSSKQEQCQQRKRCSWLEVATHTSRLYV